MTISPDAMVIDAAKLMNDEHIGALVVTDRSGGIVGMFTERDVLKRVVAQRRSPETTRIAEVMTREVIVCQPETLLDELRALMRDKRIRHVPVVDGERIIGIVSIGDLNMAEAHELSETITYLEQYMTGL